MNKATNSISVSNLVGFRPHSRAFSNSVEDKVILPLLPEDVINSIFSLLTESTLRQLSLVCKTFEKYAQSDILWQNIANNLLFPNETKPEKLSWKEFCRDFLSLYKVCKGVSRSRKYHTFKPRDMHLVERIKQLNLPDFRLLSYPASKSLFQEKDTLELIQVSARELNIIRYSFKHVAQQQVGKIQFDFFNCTDLVISFAGDDRRMHINGLPVNMTFTEDDCQLIICYADKRLHILSCDIDKDKIHDVNCIIEGFKEENLQTIDWNSIVIASKRDYSPTRAFLKELSEEKLTRIQMNSPNFTVFNKIEAKNLIETEDSANFFETIAVYNKANKEFIIRYCGQQKLGEHTLKFFNGSKHLIRINSAGDLLLNNKLTKFNFSPKSWQLFVDSCKDKVIIWCWEKGSNVVHKIDGEVDEECLQSPEQIVWYTSTHQPNSRL